MLYYEDGYVYDTSDGARELVPKDYLEYALSLGINIHGVNGDDWRLSVRQRYKSLHGVSYIVTPDGFLYSISSITPVRVKVSEIVRGIDVTLRVHGSVTLVFDNTLDYGVFLLNECDTNVVFFDLTALNNRNAAIVFSSLLSGKSISILAQRFFKVLSNIRIQPDRLPVLSLFTILLKSKNKVRDDVGIVTAGTTYADCQTAIVPYITEYLPYLESESFRNMSTREIQHLPDSLSYSSVTAIDSSLDCLISNLVVDNHNCIIGLTLIRGYLLVFQSLPVDIWNAVKSFILRVLNLRGS